MKTLGLLLLAILSTGLLAKNGGISDIGGGGNGIRLQDPFSAVERIELEDFIIGRKKYPKAKLDIKGPDLEAQVINVVEKLAKVDRKLWEEALLMAFEIAGNFKDHLAPDSEFIMTYDRGGQHPEAPVERLGQNHLLYDSQGKRVVGYTVKFNQDRIGLLTPYGLAGLITHEIFYIIARKRGVVLSDKISLFNFFLCSELSRGMDSARYQQFLREVGLNGVFARE